MLLKSLGPIAVAVLVVSTFLGSHIFARAFKMQIAFDANRTINIYFSLMFTFFAGISAMALTMFKCSANPNGLDTLSKDQSIICYQDDWWGMVAIAIVSVVLYIFGFGGVFCWAVWAAPKRFNDLVFRRRWKFLFIKMRPDVWWFALAICAKGVLMNIGFTFMQMGIAQLYWVMFILASYAGVVMYFLPWRHRLANGLDLYMNIALLFVCSLLAFYVHVSEDLDDTEKSIATAVIAINMSPMFVAAGMVLRMVYLQLHPSVIASRGLEFLKLSPSLKLFADAPDEEQIAFVERVDEWGRFYITSALHVISTEFGGDSFKARLCDGRLKSSFSSLEEIKRVKEISLPPTIIYV